MSGTFARDACGSERKRAVQLGKSARNVHECLTELQSGQYLLTVQLGATAGAMAASELIRATAGLQWRSAVAVGDTGQALARELSGWAGAAVASSGFSTFLWSRWNTGYLANRLGSGVAGV